MTNTPVGAAHAGHGRAVALTIAGASLWGTTGTSQALLVGEHSPIAVGGLRAAIAGAALLVLAGLAMLGRA